jgi:hypothetical protein
VAEVHAENQDELTIAWAESLSREGALDMLGA